MRLVTASSCHFIFSNTCAALQRAIKMNCSKPCCLQAQYGTSFSCPHHRTERKGRQCMSLQYDRTDTMRMATCKASCSICSKSGICNLTRGISTKLSSRLLPRLMTRRPAACSNTSSACPPAYCKHTTLHIAAVQQQQADCISYSTAKTCDLKS